MPKPKKCKVCKQEFAPFSSMALVCSVSCSVDLTAINKAKVVARDDKAFKAVTRQLKKQLKDKDRGHWIKNCQRAFNRFVRARDKGKLCISCDAVPKNDGYIGSGSVQAGHYKSVGAHPELRFEELNCHNQCAQCNEKLSGNLINYRPRLINKIGLDNAEWLEGPHEAKKYTIDELKEKATYYNGKAKVLENDSI